MGWRVAGWRAMSVAGSHGKGSRKRSVFAQTPVSHTGPYRAQVVVAGLVVIIKALV